MTGCARYRRRIIGFYFLAPHVRIWAPFLMPAIIMVVLEAPIFHGGSVDMGSGVGGAAGGIFTAGAARWPECRIKFPAHCPVRFSLLLSLVVPSVSIVTKSLNLVLRRRNAHQVRFPFEIWRRKCKDTALKMTALLTAFLVWHLR